jgi:ribose transport system ATP-binding protein
VCAAIVDESGRTVAVDGSPTIEAPSPPAEAIRLRCEGLTKQYPGVLALDNLTFSAEGGEIRAILGENGAGKSTLMRILGGVVQPTRGQIVLNGAGARIHSPRAARRLGVRIAFQELSLIPDFTVAENIWFHDASPNAVGILGRRALRNRTYDLLERLGAPRVPADERAGNLPFAARQIVEVVKAAAFDPHVLVLDEATAGLAAQETAWVMEVARAAAARGAIVLYISHRIAEIREVAESVTIIQNGREVRSGWVADLDDDTIVESMLGKKPQALFPPPLKAPEQDVSLRVECLSVGDAVRDVSFELYKGEILGVGGLQGHGQSELLAGLYGIRRAHGRIVVGGRRLKLGSPRRALRAGIGMALLPEDRRREGLLLGKTIRENITLASLDKVRDRLGLLSFRRELKAVSAITTRLQIKAPSSERLVTTLSGGNQQKVVIGKLLLVGAKILLFHDLTRGVDVGTKAEIFRIARDLCAEGYSILFYSTDNQEIANLADRVLVMSRGRIVAELAGDRRSEEHILLAALSGAVPSSASAKVGAGDQ